MKAGFDSLRAERLQWLPEMGVGWYPVKEAAQPYDRAYWERYQGYDASPTGDALTAARVALVYRYWHGPMVDVGIGGGRFVRQRPDTRGYDVNPHAVAWLEGKGLWFDPNHWPVPALSFWDSLEHIADPTEMLSSAERYVFMSLPIFNGPDHVLTSRHYRKDEHYWYFTDAGLRNFMRRHGFELVERNTMEQACGREDIGTYVFRRAA